MARKNWGNYFSEAFLGSMELGLKKKEIQQEFEKWQQEQQLNMLKQGYLPSKKPISTVPQGQYTEMGGQGYRFTPQIAQQQMMAQMAPYLAMTGQGDLVLSGVSGGKPVLTNPKVNPAQQKVDLEKAEKEQIRQTKSQFVKESAFNTLKTIEEVEKGINYFGLTGGLPSIPGSERMNWEVNVKKLLSGKVIDLMTIMKEASKTGATGFGQLSEKELAVLKEASTALKRELSPKDAQRYLNDIKDTLNKIVQNDPEYDKYLKAIGGK